MAARQWRRDDDKRFETALALFPEKLPNRWEIIADILKISVDEVIYYYGALDHDVKLIDSGRANVSDYPDCSSPAEARPISCQPENERKRGRPWIQEEHASFLKGLLQFKQGSWKEIARHCVKSRSATQVASHAQKYFLRQNSKIKERKRSSIHDITSVDDDEELKMH